MNTAVLKVYLDGRQADVPDDYFAGAEDAEHPAPRPWPRAKSPSNKSWADRDGTVKAVPRGKEKRPNAKSPAPFGAGLQSVEKVRL